MRDTHGAVRLVDILTAMARSAVHVDPQIARVDSHIDLLRLRQHRNRRRRCLTLAVAFRDRDALDAMNAAFIAQAAERALAADGENRFLHAAQLGHVRIHHLDPPATALRIAGVHAHEQRAKERRLLAARAAADFHDDIAGSVGVLRQKQELNFPLHPRDLSLKTGKLLLRHRRHIRIGQHRLRLFPARKHLRIATDSRIQRFKAAVLAHQRTPLFLIRNDLRIGQEHTQLLHPRTYPIKPFEHQSFSFTAYTTRQFLP